MLKMEKEGFLLLTTSFAFACVHLSTSRFRLSSLVGEAGRHRILNWFDIYLNPYCRPALMTITRIFPPCKGDYDNSLFSFWFNDAQGLYLSGYIYFKYLKTDFYEII